MKELDKSRSHASKRGGKQIILLSAVIDCILGAENQRTQWEISQCND